MKIYNRLAWKARPFRERTPQNPRQINTIYIHYSESPGGQATFDSAAAAVRGIQEFHLEGRGWSDVAYSYLVTNSRWRSFVFVGRGLGYVPAAQMNYNTNSCAICVVMKDGEKLHWVTQRQLRRLIHKVRGRIGKNVPVKPHSAVNQTSCPGDQLRAFITRHYTRKPRTKK